MDGTSAVSSNDERFPELGPERMERALSSVL
jgi:hypothetical protein